MIKIELYTNKQKPFFLLIITVYLYKTQFLSFSDSTYTKIFFLAKYDVVICCNMDDYLIYYIACLYLRCYIIFIF